MSLGEICGQFALRGLGVCGPLDRADEIAEGVGAALRRAASIEEADPLDELGLDRILELTGCSVRSAESLRSDLGGAEAMLIPRPSGEFWVLVDPRPAGGWRSKGAEMESSVRRRMRFRILHEVGHTFFRHRSMGDDPGHVGISGRAEETFCDRLAAALLLPPSIVRAATPDAAAAYQLSARFDVSVHLVARAFAELHPAVSSVSLIVSSEHGLRVQWSTGPTAAQAAVEELTGRGEHPANVHWASRGLQSLRVECAWSAA